MKPIEFAAWIVAGGVVLWVLANWRPTPAPVAWGTAPAGVPIPLSPPPESAEARQERQIHLLCDREVDALLHEKDLTEVIRAWAIVQAVNCGIERRL